MLGKLATYLILSQSGHGKGKSYSLLRVTLEVKSTFLPNHHSPLSQLHVCTQINTKMNIHTFLCIYVRAVEDPKGVQWWSCTPLLDLSALQEPFFFKDTKASEPPPSLPLGTQKHITSPLSPLPASAAFPLSQGSGAKDSSAFPNRAAWGLSSAGDRANGNSMVGE